MSAHPSGLLAAYRHVDAAAGAIRSLKHMGYVDFTVYTPVPNHEIADAVGHPVSPVRLWTLLGGLTGCVTGFGMSMWMSYDWPLVVGGKPIGSWIPYVVIAFELTVLFGAGATILGLLYHSWRSRRPAAFDGRFTDDMIGIFVPCPVERRPAVEELLRSSGAEEVRVET
jgi:molybdopterin-containing oxidoreductase family membrane subunit